VKCLSIDWDYFFHDDVYNQWDNLNIISNSPKIIIEDDHESILNHLLNGDHVVNLDAHHDSGYEKWDKKLNCGNWVNFVDINYTLYYPHWRRFKPEWSPHDGEHHYGLPQPDDYDLLFICKSLEFVHQRWHYLWDDFINKLSKHV
jgi:hypothetical protein